MNDQPEWLEWGPQRAPLWQRLSPRLRHGLTLLAVLVLGVAAGGYAAVSLGLSPAQDPPTTQPPRLDAELLTLNRDDQTDGLHVVLDVTNHSQQVVQLNRLLAQADGYVILRTSPRPPAVGGALRIPPGKSGTVGVIVRGHCVPSRNLPSLTVLAVVGNRVESRKTVAVRLPQDVREQLSDRRNTYCEQHRHSAGGAAADATAPGSVHPGHVPPGQDGRHPGE